jgi:hypothetical protein
MTSKVKATVKIGLRSLGVASLITWHLAPTRAECMYPAQVDCEDPDGGQGYHCVIYSNPVSQGWYSLSPPGGDWPCCELVMRAVPALRRLLRIGHSGRE